MGRRDGENQAPTVIGTAKPSVNAHPITTDEHGDLSGPIEHGRQHRAPDGEDERGREHGHVRPRGKSRARAGQGVTDPRVTGDGDPGWPQRCFHEAVHTDQQDGSSEDGAQDPVLDEPRPSRPGDRTDDDQQQGDPTALDPTSSGERPPSPGVGGLQCLRPIDLVAGCPLLHKADPAQAGKNHHVPSTSTATTVTAAAST